jgi:putative addiction module killer protein
LPQAYPIEYNFSMLQIRRTAEFAKWLDAIADRSTRLRLIRRIERAASGNLGDLRPVGAGVLEMREHFGPGWRMYCLKRNDVLIVMLGGGDKSSQQADIARAIALASQIGD